LQLCGLGWGALNPPGLREASEAAPLGLALDSDTLDHLVPFWRGPWGTGGLPRTPPSDERSDSGARGPHPQWGVTGVWGEGGPAVNGGKLTYYP